MINPVHRHSFLERCNPYPHVTFEKRRTKREEKENVSQRRTLYRRKKREEKENDSLRRTQYLMTKLVIVYFSMSNWVRVISGYLYGGINRE